MEIWDPNNDGLYAVPGNDVIYTITTTNSGNGNVDAATIIIFDEMPSNVEFYHGDIDDVDLKQIRFPSAKPEVQV